VRYQQQALNIPEASKNFNDTQARNKATVSPKLRTCAANQKLRCHFGLTPQPVTQDAVDRIDLEQVG
jgi:hypothetical protein